MTVEGPDSTTIVSPDGRQWLPGLIAIRYHGVLADSIQTFHVISGFECQDCDAPRQLLLLPFGADARDTTYHRFYYPGTVASEDEPAGFIRSRAFVGVCGLGTEQALTIVQSTVDTLGRWRNATGTFTLRAGRFAVRWTSGRSLAERVAIRRVHQRTCTEVPPMKDQLEG